MKIEEEFQLELGTRILGSELHLFDRVESTSDTAQSLALGGAPEGTLVVAGEQSRGRGRSGRSWFSEPDSGLYLSLVLRPQIKPQLAPVLSLAAGVALHHAIQAVSGLVADIKWPNDILLSQKKCAGILLELHSDSDQIRHLILGIGINVNHRAFPPELDGHATSLLLETGRRFRRAEVLLALLDQLELVYQQFLVSGAGKIVEAWKKNSSFADGKKVSVVLGSKPIRGITVGVSARGALQVRLESGQTEEFISGDIVSLE
ncbi:MAG TPA: biotin--[acetyl-CoA-carboxylase] ligase [Terriglobia bacterium]|nr:biotin--[acetyl-CoA-carboxylase] ligase [Terriglobia bacterium]